MKLNGGGGVGTFFFFYKCKFLLQVLLKQEGRGHNQVTRTINPSTLLSLPEGGTYILEVRALSEGGEGAVSSQVRVVTSSGKLNGICYLPPIYLLAALSFT